MQLVKRKLNFYQVVIAAMISFLSLKALAFGGNSWERTVNNQSQRSWTVKIAQPSFGNVWFLSHCANQKNGTCSLPAHQQMKIKYTTDGKAKGKITFIDYEGNQVSFNYQSAPQIFSFSTPVKVVDKQSRLAQAVVSKNIIAVNTPDNASFSINADSLTEAINCRKASAC